MTLSKFTKQYQTKICHHQGCIHNYSPRPVSEFRRLDALGRVFTHKVCNHCNQRERIAARDRERFYQEVSEVKTPTKKLLNKPVWMVIYRSYWP